MRDRVQRPARLTYTMAGNILLGVLCFGFGVYAFSSWRWLAVVFLLASPPMVAGAVGLWRGSRRAQWWALAGFGTLGAITGLLGTALAIALATGFGNPEPDVYLFTGLTLLLAAAQLYSVIVVRSDETRHYLWERSEADLPPEPWELEEEQREQEARAEGVGQPADDVMFDFYEDPRTRLAQNEHDAKVASSAARDASHKSE